MTCSRSAHRRPPPPGRHRLPRIHLPSRYFRRPASEPPSPSSRPPQTTSSLASTCSPWAEPERAAYQIVHLHPAGQRQHVAPVLVGDFSPVLEECAADFLQREPVFAHLDEVVKQLCMLSAQPVVQPDQQAVQPPGQVLVISSYSRRTHHIDQRRADKATLWIASPLVPLSCYSKRVFGE